MSPLRTILGGTVYFPKEETRGGRRYVWLWVRRPSGRISQALVAKHLDEMYRIEPCTRVRVRGRWRKRRTSPFRMEDRRWFLVAETVEVLWVPPPGPMDGLTLLGNGAHSTVAS